MRKEITLRKDQYAIVPKKSDSSIAKPEKSKLSTVAKGLKSVGRGYVTMLNDPSIQSAMGRLYRSNMFQITGDERYRD